MATQLYAILEQSMDLTTIFHTIGPSPRGRESNFFGALNAANMLFPSYAS
jgi:hypothetical protein